MTNNRVCKPPALPVVLEGASIAPAFAEPIRALKSYWDSQRRNGQIPRRSNISPRGIEPLLAQAFVVEKLAPGQAKVRVAGTHLSDLLGMEVRGMPLSAFITPSSREAFKLALVELFERPAGLMCDLATPSGLFSPSLHGVMALLPLQSDLGDASRALGVLLTDGKLGAAPHRFEVTKSQLLSLHPSSKAGSSPIQGTASAALPSERPYLKLVRS